MPVEREPGAGCSGAQVRIPIASGQLTACERFWPPGERGAGCPVKDGAASAQIAPEHKGAPAGILPAAPHT